MGRPRSFAEIKRKISDGTDFGGKVDITRPRREVRELEDPNAALHKLYSQNREYPLGTPHERSYGSPVATPQWDQRRDGALRSNFEASVPSDESPFAQLPQGSEDRLRFNYRNDVGDGWLRGSDEDATAKPFFDHSPKRGKERR